MNCAQRIHLNYLEGITLVLVLSLISGIRYPGFTFYAKILYVLGRLAYSFGYVSWGPFYRVPGALMYQGGNFIVLVLGVKTCLDLMD